VKAYGLKATIYLALVMMAFKIFGDKARFFNFFPLLMWLAFGQWGILAIICQKTL